MIDIKIYSVDYGFCAVVSIADKHTILIDSGYSSQTGFMPSPKIIKKNSCIDCLVMPAYHKNHLSSLPDLLNQCLENNLSIHSLISNPTVTAKDFPEFATVSRQLENMLLLMEDRNPKLSRTSQTMRVNDMDLGFFWNIYPDFQDVHNLSLVTFLSYRDVNVIFPSNLEKKGWHKLLENDDFCDHLSKVNVFIAADHGREEGYCPQVFEYCTPEFVIISNKKDLKVEKQLIDKYQSHLRNSVIRRGEQKLFITQEEGTITISKYLDRLFQVTAAPRSFGRQTASSIF